MNRMKFRDRFGFRNHNVLDKQIDAICEIDLVTFVYDWKRYFLLNIETTSSQFEGEACSVRFLEEARAEHRMHLDGGIYYLGGDNVWILWHAR